MIKGALNILLPKRHVPDNFIFYLHYRWTVLLLVTLSFIITCRLVLGDSFSCGDGKTVDTRCYANSVFSLPAHLTNDLNAGVIQTPGYSNTEGFRRYQSYYSWVNLLFLIHAFNFYLPHLIWKSFESGRISRLTSGLETFGGKEEKRGKELCYLAKYITATQGNHRLYTSMYILCEVFNYAIALSHTLWLVHFFDVTGVPDLLDFQVKTWWDFQLFYFPPSGMCMYHKIGASGATQRHSVVCILPLNRLYMIMFLFVHAWYILLTILSGAVLVYRIALLVPRLRENVTRFYAPLSEVSTLKSLCSRLSFSDWFFLARFQRIMTDIDFAQMLEKMVVISQCNQRDEENRLSLCDEIHKELDSSTATSPV